MLDPYTYAQQCWVSKAMSAKFKWAHVGVWLLKTYQGLAVSLGCKLGVNAEVWRTMERGVQVVEEESMVFSTIEVGVKHAGPSGLGDLEVKEYIACTRCRPLE